MTQVFILLAIFSFSLTAKAQSPNPIVQRISNEEIRSCTTPSAVAYNYVEAILYKDFERAKSYMTSESVKLVEEILREEHITYEEFFSMPGSKLNILGWWPALIRNYEVAVLYVQSEGRDEYNRTCLRIYVGCVPSDQVGLVGFQDITTYGGTNVKILVVHNGEKWECVGFI